jgi:hypothetical protein
VASFGYDGQGRPGSTTSLLIRGESLIWFISIDTASVVVAAIDLDKAGEMLKELFKPAAAPPVSQPAKVSAPKVAAPRAAPQPAAPKTPPTQAAAPAGQKARFCPDCGQPATWVEQYKRWYCYKCKKYLP